MIDAWDFTIPIFQIIFLWKIEKNTIINYSALGKRNNSWHTLNKIHTWSDLQPQKWIDPANHNIIGEVGKSCWFVWWISHICGCRHLAAGSTLSLGPMSFKKTYRLLNCTLSCSPRQVIQFLFKYRHQTVKSIILDDFFFLPDTLSAYFVLWKHYKLNYVMTIIFEFYINQRFLLQL